MKKIVMIGSAEQIPAGSFSAVPDMQLVFSENADVPPDAACVLVAQEAAGEKLPGLLRMLRTNGFPFAVLTADHSEQNQERLLDAGAVHIFLLPMSPVLLQKRVRLLANTAAPASPEPDLFAQLLADQNQHGAYVVQEADFVKIYRLMLRLQERLEKKTQFITFSFHTRLHFPPEPGTLEEAFCIVQKCLRRGDITCMYGNTVLCLLPGADTAGGTAAAERIVSTYEAHMAESCFSMRYEIRDIR